MNNIKRILLFSDSHGLHGKLELPTEGIDMAIFAGDAGTYKNPVMNVNGVLDFIEWYASIPIKYKIWIAGNHSMSIEAGLVDAKALSKEKGLIYLEHETKFVNGIEIFGSPYTPSFCGWAYNVSRNKLRDYWSQIPVTTEFLVVHGGPHGIGGLAKVVGGEDVGCVELETVIKTSLPNLSLLVCGHLHESYGYHEENGCMFVNASVLNEEYKLVNKPFIVTMDIKTKKILKIE